MSGGRAGLGRCLRAHIGWKKKRSWVDHAERELRGGIRCSIQRDRMWLCMV